MSPASPCHAIVSICYPQAPRADRHRVVGRHGEAGLAVCQTAGVTTYRRFFAGAQQGHCRDRRAQRLDPFAPGPVCLP